MKTKLSLSAIILVVFSTGCDKDPAQVGCTDPIAVNYDPQALEEDGTCAYNDASQSIWNNGVYGGWNGDVLSATYSMQACWGAISERLQIDSLPIDSLLIDTLLADSVMQRTSLVFSADESERHRSYVTLINDQNARDYAEGSLRFDCRIPAEGSPELFNVFIGGKLPQQGSCDPYRRSDFVTVSTVSLNDSTFSTVEIPIRTFDKIMMANVEVVFGLEFDAALGQGIEVDNIRWTANKD